MQLIVGLGNPGDEYRHTRHNAGAWFIESLAQKMSVTLREAPKFLGLTARIQVPDLDCFLLIPTTYMNRSGQAVAALSQFYHITPQQILVVHDDLDLPVGDIRFKQSGGHGGHNGLRDLIHHIGADFWRCRIGIGRPEYKGQMIDYVLHAPAKDERAQIDEAIERALMHREDIFKLHMQKVMNAVNGGG